MKYIKDNYPQATEITPEMQIAIKVLLDPLSGQASL